MHYVIIALGILLAAGLLIWRIRLYLTAARTVVDTARDLKAGIRRAHWQGRFADRGLDAIDDPMLVATCILLLFVRCDRDITGEDRAALSGSVQRVFRVEPKQAADLIGEAEFLVRDVTDYPRWVQRLAGRLVPVCSVAERAQVLEMAEATAGPGAPSDRRVLVLGRYREAAKLG
ncbi:MAG: TerB family tellurite resistance protein [Alphaproteobacteria bacterium]